jgi:hypothetical protein
LVKVLDSFLLCPILVLVLGILGFVWKGVVPLVRQLGVKIAGEFFSFFSTFLGLMAHPLQARALKMTHQVTGF